MCPSPSQHNWEHQLLHETNVVHFWKLQKADQEDEKQKNKHCIEEVVEMLTKKSKVNQKPLLRN